MKTIGYLEGTNPDFLTMLVCKGYRTQPIGNDTDNHGINIAFITIADKIDLIVGYLHKVSPLPGMTKSLNDFLTPGILHHIPILLLAQKNVLTEAKKIVSKVTSSQYIKLIDPLNLQTEALNILR